jgi:FkbM family methyltransferase
LRGIFSNVWTFEPSRENYELMTKNLSGLDVRMWNAALGAESGTCSMSCHPRNCGDDRTAPGTDIEVVAIDDLAVDPDLIYLDVQGDERVVLEGAIETLKRSKPLVAIEQDRHFVKARGSPMPLLFSLGYREINRYRQDAILSARKHHKKLKPELPPKTKLVRKFGTLGEALVAIKQVPSGVEVDSKRMVWRHKNGSKTHFVVGD